MRDPGALATAETLSYFHVSESGDERQNATSARPRTSHLFLLAFIFLLYLNVPIVMPAFEVVHPAKLAGGAAILALLAEVLLGKRRFTLAAPEGGILIAFLGVAALSCITALWPGMAANMVADLAKMVLVYFFIANCASSGSGLRGVMWTMVIGGLVPAIAVLRNYFQGNIVEGRTGWVGIFANPNDLAYSLVILVPLAAALMMHARPIARIALVGMILLFAAGTFVTFSRGGLIGLGVVVLLIAWKQRSLMIWLLLAAMAAGGTFAMSHYWTRDQSFADVRDDATFQMRIATSEAGLKMFADHPLLGVGAGCSVVAWPLYAPPGIRTRGALITHNTFVQALAETGIAGFLTFFAFIGMGLWNARKLEKRRSQAAEDAAVGKEVQDVGNLAAGIEIALCGFAVCGLSAGIMLTWFPFILVGLASAARRIPVNP